MLRGEILLDKREQMTGPEQREATPSPGGSVYQRRSRAAPSPYRRVSQRAANISLVTAGLPLLHVPGLNQLPAGNDIPPLAVD